MPKTLRASLRAAHSRSCPNASKTAVSSTGRGSDCTCQPSYYTFHRGPDGKPVKGDRVRDRQQADRGLTALQADIDAGRLRLRRARRVPTFGEWADTFLETLEQVKRDKASTVRAYRATLSYALPEFEHVELDLIGPAELRRFVKKIRESGASEATLHKHLRHLGAILRGAEDEGHIERSPLTRKFVRELRLKVPKGDEPYTDVELAKLWAKMETLKYDAVYVTICKAAVVTGARQGELIAATWGDLSITSGTLAIRHHWSREDGLVDPKDGETRTITLIPPAVTLFEVWAAKQGVRPDDAPLFPAPTTGGTRWGTVRGSRVNGGYLTRLVGKAVDEAGLPKVGEGGRKRKPFHAFRATYARLCRERGLDPQWVQGQLGHSDPDLTLNVYGRWSQAAVSAEAAKVEAEGFPV
ncbi:MAG TPA: site-specific integrase [Sphingomicrobium sp.]|jgi:integrase